MHQAGAFFVTRAKAGMDARRVYSHAVDRTVGLICDQRVMLNGFYSASNYPEHLRRIRLKDPESGRTLIFLTNNTGLPALTLCALYKSRWPVEMFFKWIKQHLRIKRFLGASENAVKTHIWSAVAIYVQIAIVKKEMQLSASLYTCLQILSVSIFEKTEISCAFEHDRLLYDLPISDNQLTVRLLTGHYSPNPQNNLIGWIVYSRERYCRGRSRLKCGTSGFRQIGCLPLRTSATTQTHPLRRALLAPRRGDPFDRMKWMPVDVQQILRSGAEVTDRALEALLPRPDAAPVSIHRAMRHSTFAGGKRLRPILCMEAARMIRGDGQLPAGVEQLGAAIEMLHTYSLVHDDLPALDNDDLRRGKPTCHVAFGEAIAILAGDALQTLAYQTLAALPCPPAATVAIVGEISRATGTVEGMIGGQVMDVEGEGRKPTAALVAAIHRAKTGALITASVVTGGIYAGGATGAAGGATSAAGRDTGAAGADTNVDASAIEHLRVFGQRAGLAFQIVDDVLDVTESSEQLGKTAGKDTAMVKATWPAIYGVEKSVRDARELIDSAFAELEGFGAAAAPLKMVARYLVDRKN